MQSNKRISLSFGVLLLAGIFFGIFTSVPAIEKADYLVKVASISSKVHIAALFQFLMAVVYVLISIVPYSILNRSSNELALAYFSFRIIGSVFLFVGVVTLLQILQISQTSLSFGQPISSYLEVLGETLRIERDRFNHIAMILPWSIGGLILYIGLIKLKAIPVWISVWGLIGSALTLAATLMLMFEMIRIVSPAYFIMNTPTALAEIALSVYLFRKGFV